ncbi:MAG: hypothetical protein HF976_13720 [ANME-2 cluster archaeon]|nr:hypothetical protein [ANME-2 cluster archaeon]
MSYELQPTFHLSLSYRTQFPLGCAAPSLTRPPFSLNLTACAQLLYDAGCSGRIKCRCRGGGRISCLVPPEMLAGTGFSRDGGHGRVLFDIGYTI